eukprot:scaffold109828_cov16-Prasinocladus_malaysianus.AAC.1
MARHLHNGTKVELTARLAVLILRLHHDQLIGTPAARPVMAALHGVLRKRVGEIRDLFGGNLAALQHLQRAHKVEKSGFGDAASVGLPVKRPLE